MSPEQDHEEERFRVREGSLLNFKGVTGKKAKERLQTLINLQSDGISEGIKPRMPKNIPSYLYRDWLTKIWNTWEDGDV